MSADASVHVYYCDTRPLGEDQVAALDHLLSIEERERRDRLRRSDDRRDYAVAHALLRVALAAHTRQPPESLAFQADGRGKPFLVSRRGDGVPPSFSLTHTRGLVGCVIAAEGAVGIDVEAVDRDRDVLRIAGRYFSIDEAAALRRCSFDERPFRFCELWTLKEALSKAMGIGLAMPFDRVSFSIDEPQIRVDRTPPGEHWAFVSMDIDRMFTLSVAIDEGVNRLPLVPVASVDPRSLVRRLIAPAVATTDDSLRPHGSAVRTLSRV